MILESLKDERKATELIRACEELMRQVITRWQSQPHGSPWMFGLPQQQSLIVDLLIAIEQGSGAPLESWAQLAKACGTSREQFLSDVRRLAGKPIREAIELRWNEATRDCVIVSCKILPLGMRPDARDVPVNLIHPDAWLLSDEPELLAKAEEMQDYMDDLLPAMKREAGNLLETMAEKAFEASSARPEVEQSPAVSAGWAEQLRLLGADRLDEPVRTDAAGDSSASSQESDQRPGSCRENGSLSSAPSKLREVKGLFATHDSRLTMVEAAVKLLGSKRKLASQIPVQLKHLYEWIKTGNVATKRRPSRVPGRIEKWLENYLK
jgi:hypothetical protein